MGGGGQSCSYTQIHPQAILPPRRKSLLYPLCKKLDGSQSLSVKYGQWKIPCQRWESKEYFSVVRPVSGTTGYAVAVVGKLLQQEISRRMHSRDYDMH